MIEIDNTVFCIQVYYATRRLYLYGKNTSEIQEQLTSHMMGWA